MHWTGVCFANDKGGQMIYQSKVQMAHHIGSSTQHYLPHRDAHYKEMLTKTVMHIVLESCP